MWSDSREESIYVMIEQLRRLKKVADEAAHSSFGGAMLVIPGRSHIINFEIRARSRSSCRQKVHEVDQVESAARTQNH